MAVLTAVRETLPIDEAWLHVHDAGFDAWTGAGIRQHVRVEGSGGDGRTDGWWLSVETPVWRFPNADAFHASRGAIDGLAVNAHGAAVRVDRTHGRVSLVSRVGLGSSSPETDAQQVAGLAPVQARLVMKAWALAEDGLGPTAFEWRDAAPHPIHGPRPDLDAILTIPEHQILLRALTLPGRGVGHLRVTCDALMALGVGHPVRRGEDHLWLALDVGPRGALLMASVMQHPMTGPSVAATIVLDEGLEPDAAQTEADALLDAELAPSSKTWTLGSWVVRDRVDRGPGRTLMHTTFLPVGLFPGASGRALARALRAKVEGLHARYGGMGLSTAVDAPWLRASATPMLPGRLVS